MPASNGPPMRRSVLIGVLLVATIVAPPARAADRDVEVDDFSFSPTPVLAEPGDAIRWTWVGSFTHNVTAWYGATFASASQPAGSFSWEGYTGGTIGYRCTIHSTLTAGGTVCDNMCGVIAPRDVTPPAPPVITEPADGATLDTNGVTIAGTASADTVTVRLRENGTLLQDATPTGNAWSVERAFASGEHAVAATAIDLSGNESAPTGISFTVADITPPSPPVITQPAADSVFTQASVTIGGTSSAGTTSVVLEEGGTEFATASASGGTWSTTFAFGDGYHTITGSAFDVDGNRSDPSPSIRILVDTTDPVVGMTRPGDPDLFVGTVVFNGAAEDNVGVAGVTIEARNRVTGTAVLVPTTCTGCPGTDTTWSASATLPSGVYAVTAVASDVAGRATRSRTVTIVVL